MTLDFGQRVYSMSDLRSWMRRYNSPNNPNPPPVGKIVGIIGQDGPYRVSWNNGLTAHPHTYTEESLFPTAFAIGERVEYHRNNDELSTGGGVVDRIDPTRTMLRHYYHVTWDHGFDSWYHMDTLRKHQGTIPPPIPIGTTVRYYTGRNPAEGVIVGYDPKRVDYCLEVLWKDGSTGWYSLSELKTTWEGIMGGTIMGETSTTDTIGATPLPSDDAIRQEHGRMFDAQRAIEQQANLLGIREDAYRSLLADLKTGKYQSLNLPPLLIRGIELQRIDNLGKIRKLTALLATLVETL